MHIGLFVSFILFDVSFLTNCLPVCVKTDEDEGAEDLDPYELMTAVDILAKIPKDFYEKIVSYTHCYYSCIHLLLSACFVERVCVCDGHLLVLSHTSAKGMAK